MPKIGFTMPKCAYGNLRHPAHRSVVLASYRDGRFRGDEIPHGLLYCVRKDHAVRFSQPPTKPTLAVQNISAEISVLNAERTAIAFDAGLMFIDGSL
jgi:hypothetical protein